MRPSPADDRTLTTLLAETSRMRALAAALLHGADSADVDDLVQDASVAALTHRGPASGAGVVPWLRRIVRHRSIDLLRRRHRRASRERAAARPESQPAADEVAQRLALHRAVVAAVAELAEPGRDVVLRRFFDEQKPAAIAQQLGEPLATVKTRLRRALEQLRERLRREWGGEFAAGLLVLVRLDAGATAATGAIVMGVKSKLVASVAALLVIAVAALQLSGAFGAGGRSGNEGGASEAALVDAARRSTTRTDPDAGAATAVEAARTEERAPVSRPRRERLDPRRLADLRGRVIDEQGDGVAGAEVEIVRALKAELASVSASSGTELRGERHATRSGPDGRFRFDDLVRGARFGITARAGDEWRGIVDGVRAGQVDEVEVPLVGLATIAGVVVDGASGAPVEGAKVRAEYRHLESATTDTAGRFALTVDACCVQRLMANSADGRVAETQSVELARGERVERTLVLTHDADAGVVDGLVVAIESGEPIGDATVSVVNLAQAISARTAADGRFRLRPKAASIGFMDATIVAPDRLPELVRLKAATSPKDPHVVELRRSGVAIGRVVTADGAPLADAAVWARPGSAFAMTDGDGRFRLDGLDPAFDAHVLFVRHDECQRLRLPFPGPFHESTRARELIDLGEIRVGPGTLVSGRVVDEAGEPVAGARVRFVSEPRRKAGDPDVDAGSDSGNEDAPPRGKAEDFFESSGITADAEGRFDFAGVPKGRWRLSAAGDEFVRGALRIVDVPGQGIVEDVVLEMPIGSIVAGRVVDARGYAIAGAKVQAYADAAAKKPPVGFKTATSGSDGRFRLAGLEAGNYMLRVEPRDPATAPIYFARTLVGVAAGTTDLEVVLADGEVIEGDVFDRQGKAVSNYTFRALDADGKLVAGGLSFLTGRIRLVIPLGLEVTLEVRLNRQLGEGPDAASSRRAAATLEHVRGGGPPLRITIDRE